MRPLNSATLALTILLSASSGLGFMMFGVWIRVLNETHGYSLLTLSLATSTLLVTSGLLGILVGRMLQRHDARAVIAVGSAFGCCGLTLIGYADTLALLFVGYLLFAVAFACNSVLVSSILIARWFRNQQSRSARLAIATTGLSVGGIVLSPLCAYLLELYGLPAVMPWLGGGYALGGATAIALLKPAIARPRRRSDVLDVDSRLQKGEHGVFWLASVGMFLLLGSNVGTLQHVYNFTATSLGATGLAAMAVSAFSTGSFLARFAGGAALRWISMSGFVTIVAVVQCVTLVLLTLITHPVLYIAVAVCFGGTVSTTLLLQSLLVSHLYASHRYPSLFSYLSFIASLGLGLYPLLTGFMASWVDYHFAYRMLAVHTLVALLLLWLALRHSRDLHA